MPSTWYIIVRFMGRNSGGRSGVLTRFAAEVEEYLPRQPTTFRVTIGPLEQVNESRPREGFKPVPLPLILPADGREKVIMRVTLTFTNDPAHLAADLRELRGVLVRYTYAGGDDDAPTERAASVEVTFAGLKDGLRSYWLDTGAWRHLARELGP